jgi:plasmid maintenance system antidote protein VapI
MPDIDLSKAEIAEMFGGEAGAVELDADEIEVSLALQAIRDQLLAVAEKARVGVTQLANRLHISPSAVSRLLGGESDMRVSTAVLYARALGCRWDFRLAPDDGYSLKGNNQGRAEAFVGIMNTSTMTTVSPYTVSIGPASGWSGSQAPQIRVQAYT